MRKSLKGLPRPRNDYEIVAPDDEEDAETVDTSADWVEDAADIDEKRRERLRRQREQFDCILLIKLEISRSMRLVKQLS